MVVRIGERRIAYRLGAPGDHIAQNSLAVVAALQALGADVERAIGALADLQPAKGRGSRVEVNVGDGTILLIDESYNANPASMRSALAAMATVPRARYGRRIAVLGDMLELGQQSGRLHEDLKEPVDAAEIDLVFACGPGMQRLFCGVAGGAARGLGADVAGYSGSATCDRARRGCGDDQGIARITHGAARRSADATRRSRLCRVGASRVGAGMPLSEGMDAL